MATNHNDFAFLNEPAGGLQFEGGWHYNKAQESMGELKFKDRYELFIGGKFIKPHSKKYRPVINPATADRITQVADANGEDVNLSVISARKAYDRYWKKMKGSDRGKYLFRVAQLITERARDLAIAETLNTGKPIRESRDIDLPLAAAHFFYYAGWADKLKYAFPSKNVHPLGVAGQIIPWNFPLLMAAWKIAPALATGNTVVLKPA